MDRNHTRCKLDTNSTSDVLRRRPYRAYTYMPTRALRRWALIPDKKPRYLFHPASLGIKDRLGQNLAHFHTTSNGCSRQRIIQSTRSVTLIIRYPVSRYTVYIIVTWRSAYFTCGAKKVRTAKCNYHEKKAVVKYIKNCIPQQHLHDTTILAKY